MTRKSRLRLDTLTPSGYDDDELMSAGRGRGDGICPKLAAVCCSILGIAVLVSSFLLLRNERLQASQYWKPSSALYYKAFPAVLLGCAATTTASSIFQIIGSLMLLFQDITINIWKWLNFTVLMISAISILLLKKENQSDLPLYDFYFVTLVVNCIVCAVFLVCNIRCTKTR